MIDFKNTSLKPVSDSEMENIYNKIKTPYKKGAVLKWDDYFTDSPSIFKKEGKFYMYFIAISKDTKVSGYETHLAVSENLTDWEYLGPIFKRNDLNNWDSKQCAGYAAYFDINFEGSNELGKVNGNYYISYLAGNSDGYEPDPLFMGLAKTKNPLDSDSYVRFKDPILKPDDPDVRENETLTLYKSFLFEDPLKVTGYKYVNIYNAKPKSHVERLFLAVSDDGENWERYGNKEIFDMKLTDPDTRIAGDPQIILIDDIYVMIFFHYTKGKGAYNTFACSRDLVNWKLWDKAPLIEPTEAYEDIHAHKPWFVRHNGVNYHFYCAVNRNNERFIALATSEP